MSDDELESYWDDVRGQKIVRVRGKRLSLVGCMFGRLTVQAAQGRNARREALWACRCRCGGSKLATSDDLMRGRVRSCGCWAEETKKRPRSV